LNIQPIAINDKPNTVPVETVDIVNILLAFSLFRAYLDEKCLISDSGKAEMYKTVNHDTKSPQMPFEVTYRLGSE
jgi:hypothetical protein